MASSSVLTYILYIMWRKVGRNLDRTVSGPVHAIWD